MEKKQEKYTNDVSDTPNFCVNFFANGTFSSITLGHTCTSVIFHQRNYNIFRFAH